MNSLLQQYVSIAYLLYLQIQITFQKHVFLLYFSFTKYHIYKSNKYKNK